VADFTAGGLNGRAPLFERFVAGNSRYLRGWNRWDLAPLGGNRLVHGTLEYQYRVLRLFYDTGSVWDRGDEAKVRHSLGLGLQLDNAWREARARHYRGGFTLAVAFPVKEGRAEPVFLVGMNF
jgi:outer membrane protein assembly factor BamA